MEIKCSDFTFFSNFDSGNLAKVELVSIKEQFEIDYLPTNSTPDYEFNIWTLPDCYGTEFENINRTWFFFGIRDGPTNCLIKLNITNLNKQNKMYHQGMAPVYRVIPGHSHWRRIKETPVCSTINNAFVLGFNFRTTNNPKAVYYFAFTYPFSYKDLQDMLLNLDKQYLKPLDFLPSFHKEDDIYYYRECLCYSLEQRRVDLITISSYHGITKRREPRLRKLFPEDLPRPFSFNKKVIFVSARVHPGETPSSFVLNGLIKFLLSSKDSLAKILRKLYVFKFIPMLNPDGVARGHYRTDTRGVNLNRVYSHPNFKLHPSIYGAKALILYHHDGKEDFEDEICDICDTQISQTNCFSKLNNKKSPIKVEISNEIINHTSNRKNLSKFHIMKGRKQENDKNEDLKPFFNNKMSASISSAFEQELWKKFDKDYISFTQIHQDLTNSDRITLYKTNQDLEREKTISSNLDKPSTSFESMKKTISKSKERRLNVKSKVFSDNDSRIFLYVDLHGHASKKGIFMYGNYFENIEKSVECMLFPKIMSLNSKNFHFSSCNFTKKNMYTRDRREGLSREGSGRVSTLKSTGIIRSYTLECNYNTGRFVNFLPPYPNEIIKHNKLIPPKYGPKIFEETGKALGITVLDITNSNPHSRLPNSEYRTINGIRLWLRNYCVPEIVAKSKIIQDTDNQNNPSELIPLSKTKSITAKSRQLKQRLVTAKSTTKNDFKHSKKCLFSSDTKLHFKEKKYFEKKENISTYRGYYMLYKK